MNADRAGGAVFAWGARALFWSRNGGKTWKKLKRPTRSALTAVDFVTTRQGFALAANGRVWKTRNGGRKWRELTSTGTDDAVDLSFGGPSQGWLVLRLFAGEEGGHLLRTTDQGRTWRPQLVDDDLTNRGGIAATGRYTGLPARGAELAAVHDHRRRPGRPELHALDHFRAPDPARQADQGPGQAQPGRGRRAGRRVGAPQGRSDAGTTPSRPSPRAAASRRRGRSAGPPISSRSGAVTTTVPGAGSRQLTVTRR